MAVHSRACGQTIWRRARSRRARSARVPADATVGWRFTNPNFPADWTISLGETAERVACRYGITREEQDAFALESQRRTAAALGADRFRDEIVPVRVTARRGEER